MRKSRRRSSFGQSASSFSLFSVCTWRRLLHDDSGALAFAEYAIILAIIGGAIALATLAVGSMVSTAMNKATVELSAGNTEHASRPAGIRIGEGAFIEPGAMYVGSWYPIEFIAAPNTAALSDQAEGSPLTRSHAIFVSKTMRVTLLPDPNFQIRQKSQALQETGSDLSASWQWDVKPITAGTHLLIAQVDVLSKTADGHFQVFNRYSRRVSVRVGVGPLQDVLNGIRNAATVGDALTVLFKSFGATLLALAALLGAVFGLRSVIRKHRKRGTPPHDDEGGPHTEPEMRALEED